MNFWETVLTAAFATIGSIEYVKGFTKNTPGWAWRIVQPVFCLVYAAVFQYLPEWIRVGILALALSQIGYDAVISAVKKRIGAGGGAA